ncbi:MAG: hypothetical protein GC204_19795 [Chloroflexi bacterium]|nr:hypothetical protein [Chloroflexota bacterium]
MKLSTAVRRNLLTLVKSVALLLALAMIGLVWWMQSDQWSISEVNQYLGAAIPMDAFNINISGHKGLNPSLGVSFDAPPEPAVAYAKALCGSKLYQRYDPFNAIDVDMPSTHAYPITLYGKTYYSFSTLATDDDWGNRCDAPDGIGYVQVFTDRRDATLHHVKAEYSFACYSGGCQADKAE